MEESRWRKEKLRMIKTKSGIITTLSQQCPCSIKTKKYIKNEKSIKKKNTEKKIEK